MQQPLSKEGEEGSQFRDSSFRVHRPLTLIHNVRPTIRDEDLTLFALRPTNMRRLNVHRRRKR